MIDRYTICSGTVTEVPGVREFAVTIGGIERCSGIQGNILSNHGLTDIADGSNGIAVGSSLSEHIGLVEHPGSQHTWKGRGQSQGSGWASCIIGVGVHHLQRIYRQVIGIGPCWRIGVVIALIACQGDNRQTSINEGYLVTVARWGSSWI